MRVALGIALLALAACTSRPRAVAIDPLPQGEVAWRAVPGLPATWRTTAAGLEIDLTLRRAGAGDVVHVSATDAALRDLRAQPVAGPTRRIAVEVAGVAPGTPVGTTDSALGWHLVEHGRELRAGEAVELTSGWQRMLALDAGAAFGAARLADGVHALTLVVTDDAGAQRVPLGFRVGGAAE